MKTECQYFSECQKSHVVTTLSRDIRWKAGTHWGKYCGYMLPEHVPRVTSSFLRKPSDAWNSTGLNSCAIKQGQNDLSFECFNMCTVLTNCSGYDKKMNQSCVSASYVTSFVLSLQHTSYANLVARAFPGNEVGPVRTHEGAYPRFMSPKHVL